MVTTNAELEGDIGYLWRTEMKGIRAWHIVALLAIILLIRAVICWSNGLLFTLFGLNDVYSYAAPMWLGAASWAGAFAVLLRWARP